MCGICGIYSSTVSVRQNEDDIRKMNHIQRHRGPDDEGIYMSDTCLLGHRRLSIIDLSSAGHQPFVSHDQRYVLTYNGEVYNYIELRDELKSQGHTFHTQTDTEVLLHMYMRYGAACLEKLNGMFAFAILDTQTNELFLARDRLGIKPLYYMSVANTLYFASEIKALRAVAPQPLTTNEQAVCDFLCFNRTDIYDETFYCEIMRVPKGHYAICNTSGMTIKKWWDPHAYIGNANEGNEAEIIEELMLSSVQLRMRSDVPVGSCLSGGLDSSILVGIVNKHYPSSQGTYKTFTASFPGHPLDEMQYVESLREKMSFVNYVVTPTAEDAAEDFSTFSYHNDEPVSGPSFYSQYEVMRRAREEGVVVILDGQGGDENFAGYQYFHGFYLHGFLAHHRYYAAVRELVSLIRRRQDTSAYATLLFQLLPPTLKKKVLLRHTPYINKIFFHTYCSRSRIFNEFFDTDSLNSSLARHFQYKLEHLLRTEDRNSMAFSVEARVPYLDYRLVEYILSRADTLKITAGETKYLQKAALGHYSIPEITQRKDKIGFGTPVDDWMTTPQWSARYADSMQTLLRTTSFINTHVRPKTLSAQDKWKICSLAECMN